MPCKVEGHNHKWKTQGPLVIEKCERFCGFCEGDAAEHEWKYPWFLRRHVRAVHVKTPRTAKSEGRPDGLAVTVSSGWTEAPNGIPKSIVVPRRKRITKNSEALKMAKAKTGKGRGRPRKTKAEPETSDEETDYDMLSRMNSPEPNVAEASESDEDAEVDSQAGSTVIVPAEVANIGTMTRSPPNTAEPSSPVDMPFVPATSHPEMQATAGSEEPVSLPITPPTKMIGEVRPTSDLGGARFINPQATTTPENGQFRETYQEWLVRCRESFAIAARDLSYQGLDGGLCHFDIAVILTAEAKSLIEEHQRRLAQTFDFANQRPQMSD